MFTSEMFMNSQSMEFMNILRIKALYILMFICSQLSKTFANSRFYLSKGWLEKWKRDGYQKKKHADL
jgi:Na+(H+)/acetate symporter ActP